MTTPGPRHRTTTYPIDGVGEFEESAGPNGIRHFSRTLPPVPWLGPDPIGVSILLEEGDPAPGQAVDEEMVRAVVRNLSGHLHAALSYVRTALIQDPGFFGLTDDEVAAYEALEPGELPLADPDLTFRAGPEWDVRFAEGSMPICDPYGLIVTFHRDIPVRIEDLSAAEDLAEEPAGWPAA